MLWTGSPDVSISNLYKLILLPLSIFVFIAPFCAASIEAQTVFKCKQLNAKGEEVTVFSQVPCAPDAEKIKVKTSRPSTEDQYNAGVRLQNIERENEMNRAVNSGLVIVGMNKQQAIAAWGRPSKTNVDESASGVSEQWVYDRGYIYFDDGVLTHIQNRDDDRPTGNSNVRYIPMKR